MATSYSWFNITGKEKDKLSLAVRAKCNAQKTGEVKGFLTGISV
jgi:hypothetical protein